MVVMMMVVGITKMKTYCTAFLLLHEIPVEKSLG